MVARVRSERQLPATTETRPRSSNWGGAREGAGGGPKRMEIRSLKNEVLFLRQKYKKMPLHHLLGILNTDPPEPPQPPRRRNRPTNNDDELQRAYEASLEEHKVLVKAHVARQDWAAVQAAPFMHHRLSAIEISGPDGGPIHQKVDIRKLSDKELDMLESLVKKAAIVTLDEDQYHEVE